jgi:hypothetical protein
LCFLCCFEYTQDTDVQQYIKKKTEGLILFVYLCIQLPWIHCVFGRSLTFLPQKPARTETNTRTNTRETTRKNTTGRKTRRKNHSSLRLRLRLLLRSPPSSGRLLTTKHRKGMLKVCPQLGGAGFIQFGALCGGIGLYMLLICCLVQTIFVY